MESESKLEMLEKVDSDTSCVVNTLTDEMEELKKREGLMEDIWKHFQDNEEQLLIENEGLKEEVRLLT